MKFYFILLPVLLLLTACANVPQEQMVTPAQNATTISVFPLAIAVQIDYQDEAKLSRINQLIAEQKASDPKQRARLFYQRGLIYDRMGLTAHSRYDFSQAINADPTYASAYNSLGLYQLLVQSYDEALESFDSALELSEKMDFSYLHRAATLYQVQRFDLASEDIELFYLGETDDPYRILWRFIINSKIDKDDALVALQEKNKADNDNRYAWSMIDVIAGRVSENLFFENIATGVTTNKELAQRLCEAYFYLGHWHKLAGNLNKSIYYFRMSTATNIHEFIEYKYSLMELAAIQEMLKGRAVE